jgi:PAS domain S-box-containing protein
MDLDTPLDRDRFSLREETPLDQANTRTRQAEARTVQANSRTDQANLRTDEANTRTEHAEARNVQTLLESGISYRRLFETAQDGILILDAESGQVVDANPFMKALLGYSQEEFLGRKLWDIGPFKGKAASKVAFAALQLEDRLAYEGLPLETKDGRRVEVEFISNAYLEGKTRLIQCNIRDTTERRQAEKTAMRLAAIVECSEDAIIGKDLDNVIQSWNGGAQRIFGYTAAEMIGGPMTPLIPVGRLDEEQQILEKIARGDRVPHFDTVRQGKNGQQIDVSVTVSPIKDSTGRIVGSSKVVRDITESKRVEKRIIELNAELEAFSYSVSHDLRAPLRHVIGFVELLQRESGSSLSEKGRRHLGTISQAAKRMGSLIDDLLSFSQIGRSGMKKSEVNLDELVRDTLGDFEVDLQGREVVWEIHPLPVAHCDRALLRMVLVNLISNAIKFTAHCTKTRIEIGAIPNGDDETVIFIRDNGVGFDPRYVGKLFGVFHRLHSAGEFEGTGIGLANVQRIIHRHGGRVWAEGAVNGGATFYLSLPTHSHP